MSALTSHYTNYEQLIARLKNVIQISQRRVTDDPPDPLMLDNINFFTKAYLVSLCTYLEAFLQDVAVAHISEVQSRLTLARIPKNVVLWATRSGEIKEKDYAFCDFTLSLSRDELANELSGNPYKTILLFKRIGIDLRSSPEFEHYKVTIGSVVQKRNLIIHHNDSAADITMADLLRYADEFLGYMQAVDVAAARAK